MATLFVRLFGKLSVCRDELVIGGFDTRKTQELFCYLLLHRERAHPRETLADVLWGDVSAAQAKRGLRQSLWLLQSALNDQAAPESDSTLLVEPEWIQFNADAACWIDVAVIEQAFAQVRDIPGIELDAPAAQALREAVRLYRGDLLEGWYADWCLFERERLQSIYLGMLDRLMDYSELCGEYDTAIDYGTDILRYDGAREHTHRRLMRLHYLAGNRTAALRQFERCAAALHEELGAHPARSTLDLRDQILSDDLGHAPSASPKPILPQLGAPGDMLGYLRSLQRMLAAAESQIQNSIDAAEASLRQSH